MDSRTATLEIDCKQASHRQITAEGEAIKISIKWDTDESNVGDAVHIEKNISLEEESSQNIVVCSENHTNNAPDSKGVKICQFFKKSGNCRFGNKCYYLHTGNTSIKSEQKSGKPSSDHTNECNFNEININTSAEKQTAARENKDVADGENSYLNISSSNSKPCIFFSTKKGCKLADDCPFTHYRSVGDAGADVCNNIKYNSFGESESGSKETKSGSKVDSRDDLKPKTKRNQPSKKCMFFQRDGFCRKGEKCNFSHVAKGDAEKHGVYPSKNPAQTSTDLGELKGDLKENGSIDSSNSKKTKKCYYFKRNGCRLKDECPYVHDCSDIKDMGNGDSTKKNTMSEKKGNQYKDNTTWEKEGGIVDAESNKHDQQVTPNKSDGPFKKSNQYCTYYLSLKGCFRGENCGFLHPLGEKEIENSEDYLSRQKTEYKQLEIRFSAGDKFKLIQSEPSTIYSVVFEPSDPDWGIVVKEFVLRVEFPSDYPKQLFNISLEDNEIYPEGFTRFMNEGIQTWIKERQQCNGNNLAFRPFLKWFDRNVESLVLDAGRKVKQLCDAQEAGITLIPHERILQMNPTESIESPNDLQTEEEQSPIMDNSNDDEDNNTYVNEMLSHDDGDQPGGDGTISGNNVKLSSKVKVGTELKFSHLEVNENVASITLKNLLLIVQCLRCKGKTEFNLQAKKKSSLPCKKCRVHQTAAFHPEIVHQYSHVAGYLHIEGCKAFDAVLLDSTVIVNCLNCSKDNIKKGIAYGKKGDHWCEFCHTKMEIQIMSSKFTQLQKNGEKLQEVKAVGKKAVKYPGIKEGSPLPDNGTCKHYKKSYRWLRFPCCGKVYPCDICHEEGEENDHEMKFATRMICGFCSKEQPFAKDKPCVSCKANVTKSRSTHWEGGKGCRNRTTMDRNDGKKTAGLGKTISRKKATEE